MQRLFNMDNPLFRFLSKVADLMILNLLFLLCSIPVVTIGASSTAMYYTALKMIDNEEGYISRNFFHSFKENFKQATVCWLIFLFSGAILVADILILRSAQGTFPKIVLIAIVALCIFYLIMLNYVFAVLSRFYNSTKNTFKNALIMSIVNLPYTLAILALTIAPVLVTLINGYTIWYGLLVWIMVGFSATTLGKCYFFDKIFKKYMPEEEAPEETEETDEAEPAEEAEADPDNWVLEEDEVIKAGAFPLMDDTAPANALTESAAQDEAEGASDEISE